MQHVNLERRDGTAEVLLDRPPANAIESGLTKQVQETFEDLEEDEDVDAVVFSSAVEGFFSAGLDLPELTALPDEEFRAFLTDYRELFHYLHGYPKPVVAALPGHTVAGGAVWAVTADYRLASPGDWGLAMQEVNVGMPIPEHQALIVEGLTDSRSRRDLLLRGRTFGPEEAQDAGFVDELVPGDELQERARELAAELGEKPTAAFAQIKRAQRRQELRAFEERDKRQEQEIFEAMEDAEVRQERESAAESI